MCHTVNTVADGTGAVGNHTGKVDRSARSGTIRGGKAGAAERWSIDNGYCHTALCAPASRSIARTEIIRSRCIDRL